MRDREQEMGGLVLLNQVTAPLPTTSSSRLFNRLSPPLLSHGSCSPCINFTYKYEKQRFGRLLVSCRGSGGGEGGFGSTSSPYDVLGVDPSCSLADLKTAFRSKVGYFVNWVLHWYFGFDTMLFKMVLVPFDWGEVLMNASTLRN